MPRQPVKNNSYTKFSTITPNDSVDLSPRPRAIYLEIGGDVAFEDDDGNTITIPAMVSGQVIPFSPVKILATGTTATGIRGLN